jgi:hypothetical protein
MNQERRKRNSMKDNKVLVPLDDRVHGWLTEQTEEIRLKSDRFIGRSAVMRAITAAFVDSGFQFDDCRNEDDVFATVYYVIKCFNQVAEQKKNQGVRNE